MLFRSPGTFIGIFNDFRIAENHVKNYIKNKYHKVDDVPIIVNWSELVHKEVTFEFKGLSSYGKLIEVTEDTIYDIEI